MIGVKTTLASLAFELAFQVFFYSLEIIIDFVGFLRSIIENP